MRLRLAVMRGHYGNCMIGAGLDAPSAPTPNWAVALIAGGTGFALHALWSALNRSAKTRYRWTAP
jgi:hypothetical protein